MTNGIIAAINNGEVWIKLSTGMLSGTPYSMDEVRVGDTAQVQLNGLTIVRVIKG